MHDYKGKFFVILTSQSEQMKSVLKLNPGLSSYFPNVFNFDDYTPMQLLCIAADIAEKNGYALDEGALQELLDRFEQLVNKSDKIFNNGNLAKNILYSAITNQEERIFNIFEQDDVDLKTITLEDVQKIKI